MDQSIILNRLVVDERLLKRLLKHFLEFQQSSHHLIQFIYEIEQLELFAIRKRKQYEILFQDIFNYQREQSMIEEMIQQTHQEISQLKQTLSHIYEEHEKKLSFDQLTIQIQQLPTRDSFQEEIQQLEKEIELLLREQLKHEDQLNARRKGMQNILESIKNMTCIMYSLNTLKKEEGELDPPLQQHHH
jgi:sugar-specific transcriptional regulator TrmB